ncbi:MAG: tetratricopeptide repeat protein [Candidatus Babeliales bacterium]|nr:tetratricopeptide repeat protein [Candidatus Babeliales bacterium]
MIQYFLILSLFVVANVSALFTYDRVARLMQKGEFDKAKPLLQKMVVDSPDNPEILYDAGVASYKTKDFKQAAAYFKQAAHMPTATNALKEKAYFNSANTAVELKELQVAVADYEHVLEINPGNEQAKHNLQKVKEMLEKQQQEDKQDKKDKKDDKEKDKEDKDKKEESDKDDSQDGEQSKDKKSGEQDSKDKKNNAAKDGDKKDEKQSQEQSQKDDSQDTQKESDQKQNGQKEQQDEHEKSNEEKKSLDKDKSEAEKMKEEAAQEAQEDKDGKEELPEQAQAMQKMAPYLAKILDEQEKKDAALHKTMVKQAVGNNMAGHNGQNNW